MKLPGALQRKIDALLEEIEMCELLAERIEMLRESEIEAQLGGIGYVRRFALKGIYNTIKRFITRLCVTIVLREGKRRLDSNV